MQGDTAARSELRVDFAGEIAAVTPGETLRVGREGDLVLDDNPYLHRLFLQFVHRDGMWWICNMGNRIPASLTDEQGLMRSTLAAGAALPLVFPATVVTFSAGRTTYELLVEADQASYVTPSHRVSVDGRTTLAPTTFTESQRLAILALAEPVLRRAGLGAWEIPAAVDAAARLGWTPTRFGRKIDNVCDKLSRAGVQGLHGGAGQAATNRRMQLVEYAVSTFLVTPDDLPLLDREAAANRHTGQGNAPATRGNEQRPGPPRR
ncbi:hypothetical protein [Flexivirga aerilata]|uniref:hypothetical protein n=1 Tax=Flexivirga aerilata TaxID=1656889 RepID=UPI001BB225DD|nr:hypothetical protein [Flexivirga aerilata]